MRMDSDEICSPELLASLRELIADRDVRQYWIERRWLWPDTAHWLAEAPWSPDMQCRLYRNDVLLFFTGRRGTSAEPCFPSRYVVAPIYHVGLLVRTTTGRAAMGGRRRMNREHAAAFHEREAQVHYPSLHHAGPPPAEVEPPDRDAIEAALNAPPRGGAGPTTPPPVVPVTTVLRQWAGRDLPNTAYRARIVPLDGYRVLRAGDERRFHVRVINEGSEHWPGGDEREPLIRPSYHWYDPTGRIVVFDGLRTALPAAVAPGEGCRLPVSVVAPATPGAYELRFDLVHEHRRWFEQLSPAVAMTVVGR
jgi:hypothetical protein